MYMYVKIFTYIYIHIHTYTDRERWGWTGVPRGAFVERYLQRWLRKNSLTHLSDLLPRNVTQFTPEACHIHPAHATRQLMIHTHTHTHIICICMYVCMYA